jgi:hypothetical protein
MTLPCRELISELVSSLPSTTTDEPLAGVSVTALLPRKLFWTLPVSSSGASQLTALSLPCMYMQRTLRDSVISSADSTRWLADRARVE